MRRYQFTASQWRRIASWLPHRTHHGGKGRPWEDYQRVVHGILWILHTGVPWRDLPERFGPWETVYGRFNRWRKDGTWNKILSRFLNRLDRKERIRRDLWCIDTTMVRATRAAGGARRHRRPRLAGNKATQLQEPQDHALGVSRGGFGTKVHLVIDSRGLVLAWWVSPGQRHDSKGFEPVLRRVHLPRREGNQC